MYVACHFFQKERLRSLTYVDNGRSLKIATADVANGGKNRSWNTYIKGKLGLRLGLWLEKLKHLADFGGRPVLSKVYCNFVGGSLLHSVEEENILMQDPLGLFRQVHFPECLTAQIHPLPLP